MHDKQQSEIPPGKVEANNRILYVIGSLDVGGAERHLVQVCPRLSDYGWVPRIYCVSHRGTQADEAEAHGVSVVSSREYSAGIKRWSAASFLSIPISGANLLRQLAIWRPNIVHFFLPVSYVLGGPASLVARTPIRVMSRRSMNNYQQNTLIMPAVERWLHRRMTTVLGNSKRVVRQLVEEEGCPPDLVRLIYNGITVPEPVSDRADRRARLAASLDLPEGTTIGVLVANLIGYKGHRVLIEALGQIKDQMPARWAILCVGRDDGIQAELEAAAREQGVFEHVRFLGSRGDVPSILAAADFSLNCSHQEGFSNAVLEGMAHGLPMVVTDVGGNAEAVVDGECGFVVPPEDPVELGQAMVRLAADPDLAMRLGAAGRQRAQSLFSMESCITAYDALYRELVAESSRRQ